MINWRINTNSKFSELDFQLKTACVLGLWDLFADGMYSAGVGDRRLNPYVKELWTTYSTSPEETVLPLYNNKCNTINPRCAWTGWDRWSQHENTFKSWPLPLKQTWVLILLQTKKDTMFLPKDSSSKTTNLFYCKSVTPRNLHISLTLKMTTIINVILPQPGRTFFLS